MSWATLACCSSVNSNALNGFVTYAFMPDARHFWRSSASACAVRATMGTSALAGSARMARVASIPFISGIWMSISTTS